MSSSRERLELLAGAGGGLRPSGFALVVAFDFYDGRETGLAIFGSGQAVRITTLGDSVSRCFRAFELAAMNGDWWPHVRSLPEMAGGQGRSHFIAPAAGPQLEHLRSLIEAAPQLERYVCVGSPYLGQVAVSSASEEQLRRLRQMGWPAGFQATHCLVKASARMHDAISRSPSGLVAFPAK